VIEWQIATVAAIRAESASVRTIGFTLPEFTAHLPGQHYNVRLTAPDGYVAQRSYSIASSPLDAGGIELTVERLADGEVSPYLTEELRVGDEVELRGPIGGYFVWRGESPALLVGGGSGVVPLMAILRHRRRVAPDLPMRLLYSVRTSADLLYRDELGDETTIRLSRTEGRIDAVSVADLAYDDGLAFVCGSNGFVETAADHLMAAGYSAEQIKTERFGPSG
jgi:ferredoxin-NADP reductase